MNKELADADGFPFKRHFHDTHLDKIMEAVLEWMLSAGSSALPADGVAYGLVDCFR